MSKSKAFLLHAAISATVVGIVLAVIFFVWYPHPFFEIAGARNVVGVLIGVDLVLGPTLTLLFYRPGKPRLALDMSIIASIQLIALVYGTVTIYSEKPQFLIFAVDRFVMLAGKDVPAAEVPARLTETRPLTGPLIAVAQPPGSIEARNELLFELIAGAPDIEYRPQLWQSYEQQRDTVLARLRPLAQLAAAGPQWAADVRAVVERSRLTEERLGFVPVLNKAMEARSLVLDRETGRIVDVIQLDPYPK